MNPSTASPNSCDKRVYESHSNQQHTCIHALLHAFSYINTELHYPPHSRNAFLVRLVDLRHAQLELEEMEWVHPAGSSVRTVHAYVGGVLTGIPKNLNARTAVHLSATSSSLPVCHSLLPSTWHYSSSSLLPTWLQCLHPPFFLSVLVPLPFLSPPPSVQCNLTSLSLPVLFPTSASSSFWLSFLLFFC